MNSTRRKYFFDPAPEPPVDAQPTPEPEPVLVDRRGRELATASVATIGGPRRYGISTRPARGNNGRWPS